VLFVSKTVFTPLQSEKASDDGKDRREIFVTFTEIRRMTSAMETVDRPRRMQQQMIQAE